VGTATTAAWTIMHDGGPLGQTHPGSGRMPGC
jgi:hypothetical protein